MQTRINMVLSIAILATIASSTSGQGLGYPEAPHHTVTRAARYWFPDGYVSRAFTGRIGFMATNGCDAKPICSLCDYSRRRVCDCQVSHFDVLGSVTGWAKCSPGCKSCSHQKGCSTQKCATQKHRVVQKSKCVTQKSPVQKRVPQKYAPQKCATQKCSTQKCSTQKCTKSCGKSKCGSSYCPSLIDSLSGLFQRSSCRCKTTKCSSCKPTLVKSKSKSKSGYNGAPSTLPLPVHSEEGDAAPSNDPAEPPAPMLDGARDIGTGARSARSRGQWRRPRSPMPRLLPADNSARDVSRISYEELIEPEAPRKLHVPTGKRLDLFESAANLSGAATQATPKLRKLSEANVPSNPLRK